MAKWGRCVPGPALNCGTAEVCKVKGRCTKEKGKCVATNHKDCRYSELCAELGDCHFSGWKGCEPTVLADCQQSNICMKSNLCDLNWGECVEAVFLP